MERPWLKSYPQGVRPNLQYPEVPAYHFLFEQVEKHPNRVALIFMGKKVTYKELGAAIDKFAAALTRRLGIEPGDRVGIMMPNCPQNVIAHVAIQRTGAIPVQFNPLYVPREIAYQMEDSGSKYMITLDLLYPKFKEANTGKQAIVSGLPEYLPFPKNWLFPLKVKVPPIPAGEVIRFADLMTESANGFQPVKVDVNEQPGVLLYTGGTTGVSKGVILTHKNLVANMCQLKEWTGIDDSRHETIMGVLPMFHSYGYTVCLGFGLSNGATCILVPKFDPKEVLQLIAKYRPTSFPGIPTIYTGLMKQPDFDKYDLSSLEMCVSGAAPLPVELLQRFEKSTGATILEGYGLTETSPGTHFNPRTGRRVPGSVGLPFPDTDFRIVDLETREDVSVGQEGEILIRGPQVMKGYWNKPEATAKALQDGWLLTGDIGRMDEDGYLYVVDRMKDIIIASGYNVYPREIDEVLFEHPAVLEACTVGVPDEYRGETVQAFVVLKEGATATEAEILEHCRQRLANYKRPAAIEFIPELPKSAVGKILRRVLADQVRAKAEVAATATKEKV